MIYGQDAWWDLPIERLCQRLDTGRVIAKMGLRRPAKLDTKTGLKTGFKNWTWSRPGGLGPGESARENRPERKMLESQSRLDPNPGFG